MGKYSKHFIILIFGQIISIIGNSVISFLLSLYVLQVTGSASIFATICAVSAIPWAIAGPFGGVLSDKFSKKNIMVSLDFITAFFIICVAFIGFSDKLVLSVAITKIVLETIKAIYSPCVSSSISYLVDESYLIKANAIVSQVHSISSMLAPLLAGILYSCLPLETILFFTAVLFFICAIIECFMKIPKTNRINKTDVKAYNLKESLEFLAKTNRSFMFFLIIKSVSAGLCTSAIISIGLPYITNIHLALPSTFYGIASAVVSAGSLGAGVLLWKLNNKISFSHSGYLFALQGVFIAFLGLSIYFSTGMSAFVFICLTVFVIMLTHALLYILTNSFIQKITPPKALGKVISIVTIISGFTEPGGQVLYGILFDIDSLSPELIITASAVVVLAMSFFANKFCKKQ